MIEHRPLVLLDIETTGGSARYSRITEIGALRIENGEVAGTFSQLVNPEEPVPAFITRLTNITDEMLWDAPLFKGIADELELFLSDAIFVAHNVSFDYSFIKMEFERIGSQFNMDRLCSARLSRRLYPEYKSHALDRLIERLGISVQNRHRATDDAAVIWKFIQTEIEKDYLRLMQAMDKTMIRTRPQSAPSI